MKNTFAADEYVFQTLLMNSPYAKTVYVPQSKLCEPNLRLIDFDNGNGYGSPKIWRVEDIQTLTSTENCFARKFDANVDALIIEKLIEKIGE